MQSDNGFAAAHCTRRSVPYLSTMSSDTGDSELLSEFPFIGHGNPNNNLLYMLVD
jgi:hypothetical protein